MNAQQNKIYIYIHMFLSLNYRRENRFKKNGGPSNDWTALYIVDVDI
jgi:hypothetical protein